MKTTLRTALAAVALAASTLASAQTQAAEAKKTADRSDALLKQGATSVSANDQARAAAIAGAAAAFEDKAYFEQTCQRVIESREAVVAGLEKLGFEVLPSAANFVFARHPGKDAATLAAGLREQGVIVRHFKQARIAQFLRITIGTPEQNQALLDALSGL